MYKNIKVIAFDADDTLWVNEPYFRDIEGEFCSLLQDFLPEQELSKKLLEVEINNLHLYGYGVKGFILSLIETSLKITNNKVDQNTIESIIKLGKDLLEKDITLLDGVKDVLEELNNRNYRLIVATKGDLLDQQRKLEKSGLEKYFHHIEVMSDKKEKDYIKLISHLDINIDEFIMIGNSLKSDILPVIKLGAQAIHIPFHTTWEHENVNVEDIKNHFISKTTIKDILDLF